MTTAERLEFLPDVPTIAEFVPGYEAVGWNGIGAPANTPPAILDVLNAALNDAIAETVVRSRLLELGSIPKPVTREAFTKFVASETDRWGKVVHTANIKAD